MNANLGTSIYEPLYNLIQTRAGLVLDDHRRKTLKQVIDGQLQTLGNIDVAALDQRLSSISFTHPLWQDIIQAITIGETYFFRNRAHFEALRFQVLPALIANQRKIGFKQLRLWSAGCASGEEPYSLAMLLHDLIPDIETWSIFILGTDLNNESLQTAREGWYSSGSFRAETPDIIQSRWFEPKDSGYSLKQSIRDMVTFAPLNLITNEYPTFSNNTIDMNLILCRNVTIYFEQSETQKVAHRFWQALRQEGWLVIGHSEPHLETYQAFTYINFANAVMYQKHKTDTKPSVDISSSAPWQAKKRIGTTLVQIESDEQVPRELEAETPHLQAEEWDIWQQAKQAADNEKWDEALSLLDEVEKDDILQPQTHYLRALIQLQLENTEVAISSLRQAIYCDSNFVLAYYSLGDVYSRLSNKREALRWWQRAQAIMIDFDPQFLISEDEDLTVQMMRGMLQHRIKQVENGIL